MQPFSFFSSNLLDVKLKLIVLLFVCSVISGCATHILDTKNIPPQEPIILEEGRALIFGKIVFIEKGKEIVPYSKRRMPFIRILHSESGNSRMWPVEEDGYFYLIVPRGSYVIAEVKPSYAIIPQVKFEVPADGAAFYLGTLKIDAEAHRVLLTVYLDKINSVDIIDEWDKATQTIMNHNPDFTLEVEKSLMTKIPDKAPKEKRYPPGVFWLPLPWP